MTRAEHLEFAKVRAIEELEATPGPEGVANATAAFVSDLGKHKELENHAVMELIAMHAWAGLLNERTCRGLITGTN